jgi:hypothetical protein
MNFIYLYVFLLLCISLRRCRSAPELYVTSFAGNGTAGYTGENIPATSAEIIPRGVW